MELLVNVDVDDLERGISFYAEGLGLHLERRLFDSGAAEMTGASCRLFLLEKGAGTRPARESSQTRDYRRHWTPVHLDFVVDDFRAAVDRALAAGATGEGEIETHEWGRIAYLADPFGNGFCLLEFSGRGYAAAGDV